MFILSEVTVIWDRILTGSACYCEQEAVPVCICSTIAVQILDLSEMIMRLAIGGKLTVRTACSVATRLPA